MIDEEGIYLDEIFSNGPTDEDIDYAVRHMDMNRPERKRTRKERAVERRELMILKGYTRALEIDRFTGCGQVPIGSEIPESPVEFPAAELPRRANNIRKLQALTEAFGLRGEIIENYMNGIVSIMYLDSNEKGHVLTLDDDDEFKKAATKMVRKYDILPIAGLKFDGQDAPVFLADDVHVVGGVDPFGWGYSLMCRDFRFCGYIWYRNPETKKMELYFSSGIMADVHDGIMYPVAAFPRLAAKDGHMPWDITEQRRLTQIY